MYRYRSTGTAACTVPVHRYMRTQTPTKRVYLLDPNGVYNLALDGSVLCVVCIQWSHFDLEPPVYTVCFSKTNSEIFNSSL